MGWVFNATPRPHWKDPVPIVWEAGWAPGPVWRSAENLAPAGIRSMNRAARSESLYRLSHPGPHSHTHKHTHTHTHTYIYTCIHLCPVFGIYLCPVHMYLCPVHLCLYSAGAWDGVSKWVHFWLSFRMNSLQILVNTSTAARRYVLVVLSVFAQGISNRFYTLPKPLLCTFVASFYNVYLI
jgi:hypothetical protein